MCALAAMVGVFHDGVEASIVVGLPGDTPDERMHPAEHFSKTVPSLPVPIDND